MPRRRAILAAVAALSVGLAGVGLIASAAATATAAGEPGVVTTNDGRTIEGEITENGPVITVTVRGVSTTIERTNIASIDYATFPERFNDRLAALAAEDVAGRVALAREALDRSEYELAFTAIDAALAIDPLDRDARRLAAFATRQMTLDQATTRAAAAQTQPADMDAEAIDLPADEVAPRAGRLGGLNPEQINRLRQLELQPTDRVRVRFLNNVRRRFVDSQANMDIRAFIRRNEVDQALQIIERGTRDMREDVRITTDPYAIQVFSRRIHGAILQGCATSACHGGDGAGNFRLMSGRPTAETTLTNYYLIVTYQLAPAGAPAADASPADHSPFAGGAVDMVHRTRGETSLLYQYALPRRFAAAKHPVVRGWDGLVRNANERLARDIVDWMNYDLASARPNYEDIQFTLGGPRAAPGDSTTPSTEPASPAAEPGR